MRSFIIIGMAAACCAATPGAAQNMSDVTLLPGWRMEDGARMAGVRIRLAPGWKTYWRAPDGNGIPPQFDWSGSQNVASVAVHWPKPEIFQSYGLQTIGYSHEVVFPVKVVPKDANAPVKLSLDLFYGVCEDICIPAEAGVTLEMVPGANGGDEAIRAALASGPRSGAEAGIASHDCRIRPGADGFEMTATLHYHGTPDLPQMVVIESGADDVWIDAGEVSAGADRLSIGAELDYYGDGAFAFDRSGIRLTLLGEGRPVELQGCPAPAG